jgi:hypothetical protein
MHGTDQQQSHIFSYVPSEERVRKVINPEFDILRGAKRYMNFALEPLATEAQLLQASGDCASITF